CRASCRWWSHYFLSRRLANIGIVKCHRRNKRPGLSTPPSSSYGTCARVDASWKEGWERTGDSNEGMVAKEGNEVASTGHNGASTNFFSWPCQLRGVLVFSGE